MQKWLFICYYDKQATRGYNYYNQSFCDNLYQMFISAVVTDMFADFESTTFVFCV